MPKKACDFMPFSSGQVIGKESHLLKILRSESPKVSSSLAENNTVLTEEDGNDAEDHGSNLEPGEIPEALSEDGNGPKVPQVCVRMYFHYAH